MKLGLTLEGGASRTYFSVGVMDVLLEESIIADAVIGASAGIANGVSYVSGQRGRSLELGLQYFNDKRYMGMRHWLNPKNRSYYNIPFVFEELPNHLLPFDYQAFRAWKGDMFAAVTNVRTAQTEYLPVTGDDPSWKTLVASCSLPLLFPVAELNGERYMDGGISSPIPVEQAFRLGCDKNIVVITRERSYYKKKEPGSKLACLALHKYPKFCHLLKRRAEEYNIAHKKILELEQQGKIFLIAPPTTNGWTRTEKSPEKLKQMYHCGVKTMRRRINELKLYLQTEQ